MLRFIFPGFAIEGDKLIDTQSTLKHITLEEFKNDTEYHCDPEPGND